MNSKIMLCSGIKLEKDYKHVLTYTENQMVALCTSKAKVSRNTYSFIRHGKNTIEVDVDFATCLQCNYMAFQNTDYSNKWFFAFIDSIEYRNNNTTRINFTVDLFHTWFDYWTPEPCFIIREHVNDDTIGANTIPEGLETGEYIIQSHIKNTNLQQTNVVIASSRSLGEYVKWFGGKYNGIYSGMRYYCVPSYTVQQLSEAITDLESEYPGSVTALFLAPSFLTTDSGGVVIDSTQPVEIQQTIDAISTINGYTPKNKKLLTYPYVAINMSNGQGANALYHQELFTKDSNGKLRFQIEACLTPGCSIRCYPIYYKGEPLPYDEALVLGKYPQLNWTTDTYTNWLTQNGVNIASDIGVGLLKVAAAGSIAASTGNVTAGAIALGGASEVFNSMSSVYQHSFVGDTAKGNINCGDVITANLNNTFHWYSMTIKQEFARSIDDYFSKYGYKINRLKLPNQIGRTYYNYVQIGSGENIGYSNTNSSVPSEDMEKINNIYRSGVTLWHSHDYLGDYSVNNTIVNP